MENNEKSKTIIAKDIEIVGSIKSDSNIQLDGKLNGDLSCAGNAVIGNTANVKGNISASIIIIKGQINGNITAKDMIELKSTAKLTGDLRAKRLVIEDGVHFVGKSEVNPSGAGGRAPAPTDTKSSVTEISPDNNNLKNVDVINEKSGGIFGKK